MSIKSRIVLAATLVLGAPSFALAQGFDPNLGNRIPLLNEPGVYGYRAGGGGGTTWLLPDAPSATIQSAPVGLYGGGYGGGYGALQTAPVALGEAADDGYDGPYRQDAIALGMSRLYGRSYDGGGYQTAPVGLTGAGYGLRTAQVGLYGRGYAGRRYGAGRISGRGYGYGGLRGYGGGYRGYGALRSAPVGLYGGGYGGYGGYGALETAPVALYGGYGYTGNAAGPTRFDKVSSPFAGGGF